jgi:F-type H+-transporting ATPase subunit delta
MSQPKITVTLTSAVELSDSQVSKLIGAVEKKYAVKSVEVVKLVDPQLIGGLKVRVNSTEFDSSVVNMLDKLKLQLRAKYQ